MCLHLNTVICHREGEVVCCDCSRVIDEKLEYEEIHVQPDLSYLTSEFCDYNHLTQICSKFHICETIAISKVFDEYEALKNQSSTDFKKEELMSYAIYKYLKLENSPRTLKDISKYSNISTKTLWKIEKSHKQESPPPTAVELINTYYNYFELSFKEKEYISKLAEKCEKMGHSFSPSTTCAGLIYYFMKTEKKKISLNQVSRVCYCSSMSVCRFLKRYKEFVKM